MSLKQIIEDSWALYKSERFQSAFALALIAAEATARARYPEKKSSIRFKKFLNDESASHRPWPRIGVDLPPEPNVPRLPPFALPDEAPDNCEAFRAAVERRRREVEQWKIMHDRAWRDYQEGIKDVRDDFRGRGDCHIGKPRLVTTAGILYQARCELVHEGNLSTIRIIPSESEATLGVQGGDPIEFSSTWISHLLGIVACANENRGLLAPEDGT